MIQIKNSDLHKEKNFGGGISEGKRLCLSIVLICIPLTTFKLNFSFS